MKGSDVLRATYRTGRGLFNALAELGALRAAPPRDHRDAAHRLAGALCAIARAHDLVVMVHGEIPRSAALIVANHVSYLDLLAILPVCPAIPVIDDAIGAWPILGSLATAVGVELTARGDAMARARSLRRIDSLFAAGVPVLNFPEGARSAGDHMLRFWRGSFGIAQRRQVPVVPVAIRYRDPALTWRREAAFLPHYLQTSARPRLEVDLVFGAPLHARAYEPPEDLAARSRNALARALRPAARVA